MKGARIHLDLFKVFRDLAQTRNFSKTAARNYLSQSAISQQLFFLERHFGKKLIDRGKGRFALTEDGDILLEACGKILDAYREAKERTRRPGELTGTVKVETIYSIGLYHLDSFLKTFMRRHRQVNLHVEYSRSNRIYDHVLHGDCDIGIVAYPWHHPRIKVTPFKKERMAVVCSAHDPLARKRRLHPKDLKDKRFIAFDKDIPTRKAIDDHLRKLKIAVDVVQEFDNIETIKRAVAIDAGLSILPTNTVALEIKNKSLACIPLTGRPFLRPTGIIHRRQSKLSRAAKEFMKWLAG